MNYSKIVTTDVANGPGIRVSLFVSGCSLRCPGCFNKDAWEFDSGINYTNQTESELLDLLSRPHIRGLSILGGDPYCQPDSKVLVDLVEKVRRFCPTKDIWIWTGYEFEEIRNHPLTKYVDVAVVGRFDINQRDISGLNVWRGSRNQRIIDVPLSLVSGKVIPLKMIPNNEIKENNDD